MLFAFILLSDFTLFLCACVDRLLLTVTFNNLFKEFTWLHHFFSLHITTRRNICILMIYNSWDYFCILGGTERSLGKFWRKIWYIIQEGLNSECKQIKSALISYSTDNYHKSNVIPFEFNYMNRLSLKLGKIVLAQL